MAHRHKMHHRAKGGHTGRLAYNAKGSKVLEEAESTGGGFRKGGKVHGHKGKHRLDKRARGGRTHHSGSPFSSAHHGHADGMPASHPHPHHSKHKGAIHTGGTHHQRPI